MYDLVIHTNTGDVRIPADVRRTFGRRADIPLLMEGGASDPYLHGVAFIVGAEQSGWTVEVPADHREVHVRDRTTGIVTVIMGGSGQHKFRLPEAEITVKSSITHRVAINASRYEAPGVGEGLTLDHWAKLDPENVNDRVAIVACRDRLHDPTAGAISHQEVANILRGTGRMQDLNLTEKAARVRWHRVRSYTLDASIPPGTLPNDKDPRDSIISWLVESGGVDDSRYRAVVDKAHDQHD